MIKRSFILGALFAVAGGEVVGAQERVPYALSACSVLAPAWVSASEPSRAPAVARFRSMAAPTSWPPNEVLGTAALGQAPDLRCGLALAQRPRTIRNDEVSNSPPSVPRTYWLEGGVVGAIGLSLFTAVLYGGLCESQSCTRATVPYVVLSGAVGFTVGALVGGQFRKAARDTASAP